MCVILVILEYPCHSCNSLCENINIFIPFEPSFEKSKSTFRNISALNLVSNLLCTFLHPVTCSLLLSYIVLTTLFSSSLDLYSSQRMKD
jgi:hypothetical protein